MTRRFNDLKHYRTDKPQQGFAHWFVQVVWVLVGIVIIWLVIEIFGYR